DLGQFRELIERYEREHNVPAVEIAAALANLVQGDNPLLLSPPPPAAMRYQRDSGPRDVGHRGQAPRPPRQQRPDQPSAAPRSFNERHAAPPVREPRHFDSQSSPVSQSERPSA